MTLEEAAKKNPFFANVLAGKVAVEKEVAGWKTRGATVGGGSRHPGEPNLIRYDVEDPRSGGAQCGWAEVWFDRDVGEAGAVIQGVRCGPCL